MRVILDESRYDKCHILGKKLKKKWDEIGNVIIKNYFFKRNVSLYSISLIGDFYMKTNDNSLIQLQ